MKKANKKAIPGKRYIKKYPMLIEKNDNFY